MTVRRGTKALPKKVAYVANANEEEIAQIGSDKNVVGGVLFMIFFELSPRFVCRSVSIIFVCAKTKLQVLEGNELF